MSDTKFEALFVIEESRDCTVLSPAAGMKLSDVYRKFLCCEEVEIVASVRLLKGANDEDRVLIVVVNANTDVDCDFVNEVVTPIIGKTVLGKALLVLLVAFLQRHPHSALRTHGCLHLSSCSRDLRSQYLHAFIQ